MEDGAPCGDGDRRGRAASCGVGHRRGRGGVGGDGDRGGEVGAAPIPGCRWPGGRRRKQHGGRRRRALPLPPAPAPRAARPAATPQRCRFRTAGRLLLPAQRRTTSLPRIVAIDFTNSLLSSAPTCKLTDDMLRQSKLKLVDSDQFQSQDQFCSDMTVKLVRKVAELELELQKFKADKKKMEKYHREEMRERDRKETMIVLVVAICTVMYACVALITWVFV